MNDNDCLEAHITNAKLTYLLLLNTFQNSKTTNISLFDNRWKITKMKLSIFVYFLISISLSEIFKNEIHII